MSESDPLSHQSPDHRFLLASCRAYPEPCPAAKGLRIDSKGQGAFSLHLGDLLLMWPSAGLRPPPQECLKNRTKVDTNNTGYTQLYSQVPYTRQSLASLPGLAHTQPHSGCLMVTAGNNHCFGLYSKVFRETCIFHQPHKGW